MSNPGISIEFLIKTEHTSSFSLPTMGIHRYGSGFTQVRVDEDASLGGVH